MAGQVCVEGKVINKSGYNINPDAKIKIKDINAVAATAGPGLVAVSYTHLTLPTNREV